MSETITVSRQATHRGNAILTDESVTAGVVTHISEVIPNGGATVILPIDVSQVKLLALKYPESGNFTSDQAEDLAFNADTGFLWSDGDPDENFPFDSDVSTLAIPNTSGVDQTLTGLYGYDPTAD
jgi:hypothetical protein